jgi:predicted small lipoprotein YifL
MQGMLAILYTGKILMRRGLLHTLLLVFVASAMLTACGNKGPLFIPKAEQPKAEAAKDSAKKKIKTPDDSTAK